MALQPQNQVSDAKKYQAYQRLRYQTHHLHRVLHLKLRLTRMPTPATHDR